MVAIKILSTVNGAISVLAGSCGNLGSSISFEVRPPHRATWDWVLIGSRQQRQHRESKQSNWWRSHSTTIRDSDQGENRARGRQRPSNDRTPEMCQ